jgi:poly-beta-1,6-N-acetyl-D-glucosamine synthase
MLLTEIVLGLYCTFLILLYIGWSKAKQRQVSNGKKSWRISVVVPVRNEQLRIDALLESLRIQQYKNFEIIVVDDHSTDETAVILKKARLANLRILQNSGHGKKAAITTGVIQAEGELIVTTDGDCVVPLKWLATVNETFQDPEVSFAFGPVALVNPRSFFTDLQAIEFASLIGSAASTAAFSLPTMCNGANLAYRRQTFMEVGGYESNEHIASGDDEFLMRKVIEKHPDGVRCMLDKSCVVETFAETSVRTFFKQRIRWAAKWRYSTSFHAQMLALLIFLTNVLTVVSAISLFFGIANAIVVLLAIKLILEAVYLLQVSGFLNQRWNWIAFLALQFIYPFYVVITAILSLFVKVSWRGRKI